MGRSLPIALAILVWATAPVVLRALPVRAGEGKASAASTGAVASGQEARISFLRNGEAVASWDLATLRRHCRERSVEIDDPYYERRKSFRACPLDEVLEAAFDSSRASLEDPEFLLRARDGYTKPSTGERLLEPGAFLAFADLEHTPEGAPPAWEPIDRRQVDPAPFYLVWQRPEQRDPHRYPWPYQLVEIEIASLADEYPYLVPASAPAGSSARRGYEIFKGECVACHAINGQGGRVGPDLNVPRSIVEYRPREQIKAYVRDPQSFRYTSMPAHEHLSDADLDALLAYFDAMSALKRDPGSSS